ncbi:MAG: Rnf-Nqr domain containing protein [Oscillospiraceae bacterium]
MSTLLRAITSFFMYAILAIGAQNAIFTRALGVSQGIRMVNDPKKNTWYFCGALTVFQVLTAIIVHLVLPLVDVLGYTEYKRFILPAIVVVVCAVSYVLVIIALSYMLSGALFKEVLKSVTSASINSAIVGTVIISVTKGLSLLDSIGFGLGSSIGYFFAMVLISEGDRKIAHSKVPTSFQGLPITLIYISILALAVYGLTGHMISM